MPVAPLWSILFFLMMLTLGFSSQVFNQSVDGSVHLTNNKSLRNREYLVVERQVIPD